MKSAAYWIDRLELQPHPEGGFYREVYRAGERIEKVALPDRYSDARSYSTSIYFLLTSAHFSAFHRVKSDELWHIYDGKGLCLHLLDREEGYRSVHMGSDSDNEPMLAIQAGTWFAAEITIPNSYILAGCTVAPGFDFDDFELARTKNLQKEFPQHIALIERLCIR